MKKHALSVVAFALFASFATAQDFTKYNYPDRRAVIANVCPSVKITDFKFGNTRRTVRIVFRRPTHGRTSATRTSSPSSS